MRGDLGGKAPEELFTGLEPLESEPVPLAIGTDVSDVSHTVPAVMLSAACMCKGTPLHHWAADSPGRDGHRARRECFMPRNACTEGHIVL